MAIEANRNPILDVGAAAIRRSRRPAKWQLLRSVALDTRVCAAPALQGIGLIVLLACPLIVHTLGQGAVQRASTRAAELEQEKSDILSERTDRDDRHLRAQYEGSRAQWAHELGMVKAGPALYLGESGD